MILTCPQCETRFIVPSVAIPTDGRKVRCAKCDHTWHQRPMVDSESDDIPPIASFGDTMDKLESKNKESKTSKIISSIKAEIILGYKSILLGFVIVMIGYGIYAALTPSLIMGQGLTFSNVEITREDDDLVIRGDIVNTMNTKRGVPTITITTMFDDVAGDTVQFSAPVRLLNAGESATIEYKMGEYSENMTDIKLGFKVNNEN